jgi:hypothetical protein
VEVEHDGRKTIVRQPHPGNDIGQLLAIYPSLEKYVESRRLPFIALIDRFRRSLATPESTVVTCGYAFADQHINELLFDAARLYPRSEIVALFHGDPPRVALDVALELPNFTVFGPTYGVIGSSRLPWSESSDDLLMAQDGRFRLGDFAVLADLLARSRAPGEASGSSDVERTPE